MDTPNTLTMTIHRASYHDPQQISVVLTGPNDRGWYQVLSAVDEDNKPLDLGWDECMVDAHGYTRLRHSVKPFRPFGPIEGPFPRRVRPNRTEIGPAIKAATGCTDKVYPPLYRKGSFHDNPYLAKPL